MEALKWFQVSADQGDANAIKYLGVIYMHGVGVKQDVKRGTKFMQEAARKNHKGAQDILKTIGESW